MHFLDEFSKPDFKPGTWSQEAQGFFPSFTQSKSVKEFISALYEYGWVRSDFNWAEWRGEEARYLNEPELLASADVATIEKLLTTHVRQDRFCEGYLAAMFENGHIKAIMERLHAIRLAQKS
ncbi:MAG: DUF6508 domain-containing protein [Planctomycetota bacterium]